MADFNRVAGLIGAGAFGGLVSFTGRDLTGFLGRAAGPLAAGFCGVDASTVGLAAALADGGLVFGAGAGLAAGAGARGAAGFGAGFAALTTGAGFFAAALGAGLALALADALAALGLEAVLAGAFFVAGRAAVLAGVLLTVDLS